MLKSLLLLSVGALIWAPSELRAGSVPLSRLESAEDRTEALANQLNELSLVMRQRRLEQMLPHFSPALQASGLPRAAGEPEVEIKWIYRQPIQLSEEVVDRGAFVEAWEAYLQSFSRIEDLRIKVKQAWFEESSPRRARAALSLSLVGRDQHQRRAWIEAKIHLEAARAAGGAWEIDRWVFERFSSRFSRADLFSEIALPAGVYHTAPPFGSPGNEGFSAHGVAVTDLDRDGFVDVFVAGRTENFLYLNRGDGTFENGAAAAGVQFTPPASAPLFLDFDNDGDADLFLSAAGAQMLFENRLVPEGKLVFVDISQRAGVDRPARGFSAVSADINGDGFPDIYVCSYNRYGLVMPNSWSRATNGTPNLLLVNQGDGTFVERAAAWGVADARWSYAAHFGDLNGDGRPDLYVANDFGENAFFLNEGDHFRDAAAEFGLLDPGNGMGVSLGDFDNDGRLDLHVTNMSSTAGKRILARLFPGTGARQDNTRVLNKLAAGNTLFRNLGGGAFKSVSAAVGPFAAGWAFGGGFLDFDNDGWQDLHAPNGFISGKSLKDT